MSHVLVTLCQCQNCNESTETSARSSQPSTLLQLPIAFHSLVPNTCSDLQTTNMDDIHLQSTMISPTANDRAHSRTIADALLRSSHLNVGIPTRTIRITEAERNSRDNTPNPINMEDLLNRPRSNPRTRTPMRYESPLESNAFRIERPSVAAAAETNNFEARRISIRPLAGSAVGTTVPSRSITRINERGKGRSVKQGPSQRKIRKWNNQHFVGLASEIASSSGTTTSAAADVLLKAHRDAHLYRAIYDPKDHRRSIDVDRFMNDDEMKDSREQFFEGYGPMQKDVSHKSKSSRTRTVVSGEDMLNRIDQRLRRLLIRACRNSYAAAKVVELFESFIVSSFMNDKTTLLNDGWWIDLLLERPTITRRKDDSSRSTIQFYFHPTLPTGGFHRLLLHAICQFHGLNVVSRTEMNYECCWGDGTTTNGTRVLSVTGNILDGTTTTTTTTQNNNNILLLQLIGENVDDTVGYVMNNKVEESMASLRI